MVVYADILICLNTVVTYFILLAAGKIASVSTKTWRLITAAFTGGLSSLYIYLPQQNFAVELLIKLLFSTVITVTAFGKNTLKSFLRVLGAFYTVSFIYAGFMLGCWYVLRTDRLIINNGIVYFSISPVILILSTVICYYVITIGRRLLKKENANADSKHVFLTYRSNTVECNFMVDTGNTVSDSMSGNKVVIIDRKTAGKLFGKAAVDSLLRLDVPKDFAHNFRVLPYRTVASEGIMPSVKIDSVTVDGVCDENVLAGISCTDFDGDFCGIISPDF